MVSPRISKWLRRTLIVLLVLANVVVFGTYFGLKHISSTVDKSLKRTDVGDVLTPTTQRPEGTVSPGETIPRPAVTFLVIGSDSREGTQDLEGNFGNSVGQRADVFDLDGDGIADVQSEAFDLVEVVQAGVVVSQTRFDLDSTANKIARYRSYCRM